VGGLDGLSDDADELRLHRVEDDLVAQASVRAAS
jgi:hypothetical protein